jgi:hypothetical protein
MEFTGPGVGASRQDRPYPGAAAVREDSTKTLPARTARGAADPCGVAVDPVRPERMHGVWEWHRGGLKKPATALHCRIGLSR